MRGLRLWGVLTGEVSCPPHPNALVPPTPPSVPHALAEDATQADRDAAKSAEAAADEAYEEQVLAYLEAISSYCDSLAIFTQWCDEDARDAAVLSQSVQLQFAYEFMNLATVADMWSHLHQCYQPSGDSLYLSVLRQEHDLQQGDSTVDEFYTQCGDRRRLTPSQSCLCGIIVLVIFVVLACRLYFVEVFWGLSQGMYRFRIVMVGTLAQFSCPGAHAQNGVAERKHRHLLETACAMMIAASLPPHLWAEAVSISTYLINLQPSTALQGGIPLERLTGHTPDYSTLRLFGCIFYVLLAARERTKLSA
ncbi:hypothetical protein QYE76_065622 [Lolium multiflorum]|uniref:Uncharacterized protein n=1 Tax=Lolium multiflorum TaxID=4521 RepID=A0AAD8SB97_LOLMU|nr:hypothetical protein QYE76_065622 [Lolium multiflorum]